MRVALLAVIAVAAAAAPPQRVVLMEELIRVEAGKRQTALRFPLQQQSALLEVQFQLREGVEGVRVLIHDTAKGTVLFQSNYETEGLIKLPLSKNAEYRIEVENLRQRLGYVLLDFEAALIFGPIAAPAAPQTLSPKRRFFTIAISLTLFAMLLTYGAVRLTPSLLQRSKS